MPHSLITYLDPASRQPINDVHPTNSTVLRDEGGVWGGVITVEQMCFTQAHDLGNFCLTGHTLCLVLDPIPQVEHMADGRWYNGRQGPGDLMIRPAGMESSGRWGAAAVKRGGFRAINVQLAPAHLHRAVPESPGMELSFQFAAPDPQIERIVLTLRDELAAGCPSGRLFGEHLASVLAIHLLTHYAVYPAKLKEYTRGLGQSDLSRVLSYIGDNLADDLSLHDIADAAGLSAYHFTRLFKESTGQAPHQYVITQRVERAKTLLRAGRLTVGEVAQAVGFYDHAHFIRHFKRLTGLTPRAYREGR